MTTKDWLTLIVPIASALILAIAGTIFVNLIKNKEETIRQKEDALQKSRKNFEDYMRQCEADKESLRSELNRTHGDLNRIILERDEQQKWFIQAISEYAQRGDLPEQVFNGLQASISRYRTGIKGLDDCKTAAEWIARCKDRWIQDAVGSIEADYRDELSGNNREAFVKDVNGYFDWAYECLYYYGHPDNNPLEKYVPHPLLSSPFAYKEVFRFIKRQKDWGGLDPKEYQYIEAIFDEILERL
jgi:hypothetical protein